MGKVRVVSSLSLSLSVVLASMEVVNNTDEEDEDGTSLRRLVVLDVSATVVTTACATGRSNAVVIAD